MAGIPKPSEVDAANIKRPTLQQLPAEHQKVFDDIQKKIREEKEKEIQRLEEEAMKQYISHFYIDRQGKITTDAAFDVSQFAVKFDEDKQSALDSEVTNMIDSAVTSHVNNKLEFIDQNMHDIFDDRFSRIEIHLDMKSVGNNASTSNTDKTIRGSAIPTNNAIVTNSANQHSRINYNASPNANVPYGAASSLRHSTPPNFAQPNNTPITNRPNADDVGSGSIKEEVIKIFRQTFGIEPKAKCRSYQRPYPENYDYVAYPQGFKISEFVKFTGDDSSIGAYWSIYYTMW